MFNSGFYSQGRIAELMALQDIIKQGFVAFEAGPQLSYDLVVDVAGRLLRVQVKSAGKPRVRDVRPNGRDLFTNEPYLFRTKKRLGQDYTLDSFDLFALVAVDIGMVAYMTIAEGLKSSRISVQQPQYESHARTKKSTRMQDLTFAKALEALK